MDSSLFVFGLGYIGNAVKIEYEKLGYQVQGSKRNSIINYKYLLNCRNVLITVPPIDGVDIIYRDYLKVLKKSQNLQWLGYLSTTGVYGDEKEKWVDEEFICNPQNESSIVRYKIEQDWLNSDLPIHIFRLAGIYGPNRSVFDRLKLGMDKVIYKKDHLFCRAHVEDIVSTLISSINQPNPGAIYNVADDLPSSYIDVVEFACKLLRIDVPEIEDFSKSKMSPRLKEFYSSMRKVNNSKIKNELGVKLKYPTYKEGLISLV